MDAVRESRNTVTAQGGGERLSGTPSRMCREWYPVGHLKAIVASWRSAVCLTGLVSFRSVGSRV